MTVSELIAFLKEQEGIWGREQLEAAPVVIRPVPSEVNRSALSTRSVHLNITITNKGSRVFQLEIRE